MISQTTSERIEATAARRAAIQPTDHNPNPWVIVTNPGTDEEAIFSDHPTFKEARINTRECEEDWDIMRRLDDGTLTTEF